jgi:hypothetical protein
MPWRKKRKLERTLSLEEETLYVVVRENEEMYVVVRENEETASN